MRALLLAVTVASIAACGAVHAAGRVPITGIYSDMRYIPDAGDVLGTEIKIARVQGRYVATVQIAEGSPDDPVTGVPVDVTDDRVSFTTKEEGYTIQYTGRITQTGFVGTQAVTTPAQTVTHPMSLPRKAHSFFKRASN